MLNLLSQDSKSSANEVSITRKMHEKGSFACIFFLRYRCAIFQSIAIFVLI